MVTSNALYFNCFQAQVILYRRKEVWDFLWWDIYSPDIMTQWKVFLIKGRKATDMGFL
jgi:hypothetical protein